MMTLDSFSLVKLMEQSSLSASGYLSFLPQIEEKAACANIVSASKAKQSKAKQSKAKQSKAKQSKAKQSS